MARPTTKEQLLQTAAENYRKLLNLIETMTPQERQQDFSFDDRDRNIRDVLVHLFEWHTLLIKWINLNRSGTRTDFLPSPYNWKTYPQMNIVFWEKHQRTTLTDAVTMLEKSHEAALTLISTFSDEELFTKKYFPWTGTTHLGSYCISATSSHYDWAIKKINRHKKTL